jgi:glutamate N-acetyltransferase / amino-acid N-acetyltransferase
MKLPLGYRYASAYAGIRKKSKDDVGLIVSERTASAAAVFTQNRVQAAPVRLARRHLKISRGTAQAIVVNAGNANCATRTGDQVALATCRAAADELGCRVEHVIPASTGVIGVEMDGEKLIRTLPRLVKNLAPDAFEDVAQAIMTTDTVHKVASAEVSIRNRQVRVAGMTKGSGMIMPNMATTLAFVLTDAEVTAGDLKDILAAGVERSYNRISVDGDTSTNDTLAILANGASGVRPGEHDFKKLQGAIDEVLQRLAVQIVRDGEGARKLITIDVEGAADDTDAARIGRAIANSPLFKTAIAGSDPNWGRIISAAGNSGADFDPVKVDIFLQDTLVCEGGLAAEFSESKLKNKLDHEEVSVRFVIRGRGPGESRFWTCDFTEDYIRINASYRT